MNDMHGWRNNNDNVIKRPILQALTSSSVLLINALLNLEWTPDRYDPRPSGRKSKFVRTPSRHFLLRFTVTCKRVYRTCTVTIL